VVAVVQSNKKIILAKHKVMGQYVYKIRTKQGQHFKQRIPIAFEFGGAKEQTHWYYNK
jgi:hypothetical protein